VSSFKQDVLTGLASTPKVVLPKYFYDRAGSLLFDAICELPEYYVTRAERSIMEAHAEEMVAALPGPVRVVEPGAGSGTKTRLLLRALGPLRCVEYVPVDISEEHLTDAAAQLRAELPWLRVSPIYGDFVEGPHEAEADAEARTLVYFPGSTVGNFHRVEAKRLLAKLRLVGGPEGAVLLGVDLKKDPAILHAAYNDAAGVTAAFNRNLLVRINRELDGDFAPETFAHYAFYEPVAGRIEMHLVSLRRQVVTVSGTKLAFEDGESIRTECSYKYDLPSMVLLAREAGLELAHAWLDDDRRFAVLLLRPLVE
jgi:L-histidine Nalpha-methyltransferase